MIVNTATLILTSLVAVSAFVPLSLRSVQNTFAPEQTKLNMAFNSEQPSNMFDGPMALTKERDACGVGFVANTKGKDLISKWTLPKEYYLTILTYNG